MYNFCATIPKRNTVLFRENLATLYTGFNHLTSLQNDFKFNTTARRN